MCSHLPTDSIRSHRQCGYSHRRHLIFLDIELSDRLTSQRAVRMCRATRKHLTRPRVVDFYFVAYLVADHDDKDDDESESIVTSDDVVKQSRRPSCCWSSEKVKLGHGTSLAELQKYLRAYYSVADVSDCSVAEQQVKPPVTVFVAHNGFALDFKYLILYGGLDTVPVAKTNLLFLDTYALINSNKTLKQLLNSRYDCFSYTNASLYEQCLGREAIGAHSAGCDVRYMVAWFEQLLLLEVVFPRASDHNKPPPAEVSRRTGRGGGGGGKVQRKNKDNIQSRREKYIKSYPTLWSQYT